MNVVRVTHHFNTTPERVFDAWIEPQTAGKWLFATPTGQMVRVEIDAHVGGRFTIVNRRGGDDVEHTGEYLEIDRPRRLVFTFGVPKYSPLFNRVTIDIAASDAGCDLTLTQENVPDGYLRRNEKGWISILTGLEEAIADSFAKSL